MPPDAPLPPDIVGDLYRTAGACTEAVRASSQAGLKGITEKDVAQEALAALGRADSGQAKDIVLSGIEDCLRHLSQGKGRQRSTLAALLSDGTARQQLELAWQQAQPAQTSFDAAIIDLGTSIDAYGIAWALIGLESTKHVRLVWQQANRLAASYPNVDASDMLGWGWIGLRTALRHYNPHLGFRFSTYACTRITGTIRDGIRSERPVPKRLGTFARKVSTAEERLTQQLGRAPTLDEVSRHLDAELAQVVLAQRAQPEASLDEITSFPGRSLSCLVDVHDPADAVIDALRAQAVEQALARLDPEDAQAVQLLVMEAIHPTEARTQAGSSSRQMRQRKERALRQLRADLAEWAPEGYRDSSVTESLPSTSSAG